MTDAQEGWAPQPAAIWIQACPECDEAVKIEIPVGVRLDQDTRTLVIWLDQASFDLQELWDHRLTAHGPLLD